MFLPQCFSFSHCDLQMQIIFATIYYTLTYVEVVEPEFEHGSYKWKVTNATPIIFNIFKLTSSEESICPAPVVAPLWRKI